MYPKRRPDVNARLGRSAGGASTQSRPTERRPTGSRSALRSTPLGGVAGRSRPELGTICGTVCSLLGGVGPTPCDRLAPPQDSKSCFDPSAGATGPCALPENGCRIARGRAMGRISLPPDRVFQAGSIFDTSHLGHTFTETALSRCELRPPEAGRKSLWFRVGHDSSPICLQPSASPLAIRSYFLTKWTDTRESGPWAEGELEYPGGVRGDPGNCGTVEKRLKGVGAYIPGGTSRRESSVEKPRLNCSR